MILYSILQQYVWQMLFNQSHAYLVIYVGAMALLEIQCVSVFEGSQLVLLFLEITNLQSCIYKWNLSILYM